MNKSILNQMYLPSKAVSRPNRILEVKDLFFIFKQLNVSGVKCFFYALNFLLW